MSLFCAEAVAHLNGGGHVALDRQQGLVTLGVGREHDAELRGSGLGVHELQVDQGEVELNGHSPLCLLVAEIEDSAVIRIVEFEVGVEVWQLLLLLSFFGHLHHFSLCVAPAMRQVLSIVSAIAREASENDNVLLVRLDRYIDLVAIHLWEDHFKAL